MRHTDFLESLALPQALTVLFSYLNHCTHVRMLDVHENYEPFHQLQTAGRLATLSIVVSVPTAG